VGVAATASREGIAYRTASATEMGGEVWKDIEFSMEGISQMEYILVGGKGNTSHSRVASSTHWFTGLLKAA
jgi:hypothetical protein